MFFQRKKKRLLRELWRARLTKPPAPPPLSAFYGNSCLAASPQPPPDSCYWPATATHAGGDVIRPVDGLWTHQETSTTTTKERPRTRQSFCLMGHCCGDAHSTCSSVSSTTENQPRRLADSPMDVDDEEAEEKAFLAFLGKNLAQRQLETLLEVASARAETTSACVLLRRQEALNWSEDLPVIACRMWRWADLDVRHRRDTLKRIPSCPNGRDPVYICCNPSHWFRVLQPGELGRELGWSLAPWPVGPWLVCWRVKCRDREANSRQMGWQTKAIIELRVSPRNGRMNYIRRLVASGSSSSSLLDDWLCAGVVV